MGAYNLTFINDNDLFEHVKKTVLQYKFFIDLKQFSKNIIDPIKLTFDKKIYNQTINEVIENEVIRQLDKSNNNLIGYFHQNIFNYLNKDWTVPKKGYDVINENDKIFVEIKNKHNTMNVNSSRNIYLKMQSTILKDADAKCLLVEVIAARSQDIPWKISIEDQQLFDERIRRVSIDRFYEMVTGDKNSFCNLCMILPKVLDDVILTIQSSGKSNSVVDELITKDGNILKSIYLLSFNTYYGFDYFNIT